MVVVEHPRRKRSSLRAWLYRTHTFSHNIASSILHVQSVCTVDGTVRCTRKSTFHENIFATQPYRDPCLSDNSAEGW